VGGLAKGRDQNQILKETSMFKWFMRRRIGAFEQAYDYDMSYVRDIVAADPRAALIFNRIMPMARYRRDVPRDAWYAAKIAAAIGEDCGPCTQLTVKMAEQSGVAPQVLEAILAGNITKMPAHVALTYRFTQAVLRHAIEAETLRPEIVRRWGDRGLVSIAFAITTARMFPTLKYALGHGKACVRVRVAGREFGVERQAA
jgi:hypothetical protein